jgi:hypothetical protein
MTTIGLKEIRNFDLRLRVGEVAPVLAGSFAPHSIFTARPLKSSVSIVIVDKVFMTLEPETFTPVLAKMVLLDATPSLQQMSDEEIAKLGFDVSTLPQCRSLASGTSLWSFCLQINETLRLESSDIGCEFVLSGSMVLDYKDRGSA